MRIVSWAMWDLIPPPRIGPDPLQWVPGVGATGPSGKSHVPYVVSGVLREEGKLPKMQRGWQRWLYLWQYFTESRNSTVRPFFNILGRNRGLAQRLKRLPGMRETWVRSLDREDSLEKEMATHSSILAWSIPWTEEPVGLQSTGLQRVRHDWVT